MRINGPKTILRWGLAFVFFYAAIAALVRPDRWAIFVPSWIAAFVSVNLFFTIFSCYQILLAVWLFTGRKLFYSSLVATITFGLIVLFDFRLMNILYTEVGLAFASLALMELSRGGDYNHHESGA